MADRDNVHRPGTRDHAPRAGTETRKRVTAVGAAATDAKVVIQRLDRSWIGPVADLFATAFVDSPEGFARDIERVRVVRLDPVDEPGPPPQRADLIWVWPVLVIGALLAWRVFRR